MTLAERMLRDLRSTFDGTDTWHGTPLRRMVEDVDDARGDAHPIDGARCWARLDAAHARLLARVATLLDDDFDRNAAGKRYTIDFMLRGPRAPQHVPRRADRAAEETRVAAQRGQRSSTIAATRSSQTTPVSRNAPKVPA